MPNDYDKVIKENFEPLLPHLLRKVLGLELPRMVDLKDKIQITTEREMDNLKKVLHDDPSLDFGLHWEIQSSDEDMRSRNLLYYAIYYEKYRLPLQQIVIYVGEKTPTQIVKNQLEIRGLTLNFSVLDLKSVPKEVFLHSDTPEEVVLAILCDFGEDQPVEVIRQILQHLLKLIGRVPRLKKYQHQLAVLSRLRKLEVPTKNEIVAMPVQYDINTDGLYLEGLSKGMEKGIEKGIEKGLQKGLQKGVGLHSEETVLRMLRAGRFGMQEIMALVDVTETFILKVAAKHKLNIPK
jgi:predicted transposase YdaD